ncbi:hypothetical protein NDN08_002592 [Rhodosorus marinus]|uniref:Uncharacterized protein n=1 Tax=Rhodosorus marinus TaxID=101924 RepID=A0AAV8UU77_9RHOD|nr:hypothetical protein NDN08_002592 [Rhodosorus marinus]
MSSTTYTSLCFHGGFGISDRRSRRGFSHRRKPAHPVIKSSFRHGHRKDYFVKARIWDQRNDEEKLARRKPLGIPDRIVTEVEQALSHTFKHKQLIRTALVHNSVSQERLVYVVNGKDPVKIDNERLEFLGDAVLYIVLAETLYRHKPILSEGDMTSIRGRLLTREACAAYVKNLGLDKYVVFGRFVRRHELRKSTTVQGDFFEALLGALYLDGGFAAAKKFLNEKVLPTVPDFLTVTEEAEDSARRNYRNILQSYLQKRFRGLPSVAEEKVEGPDHEKRFTYSVYFKDKILGTGEGVTKKQAVNVACLHALQNLGVNPEVDEETEEEEEEEDVVVGDSSSLTEDGLLPLWPKFDFKNTMLNYARDLYGSEPKLVPLERAEDFTAEDTEDRFIYAVSMDGSLMAAGSGRTKKEAEQRAARRFIPLPTVLSLVKKAENCCTPESVQAMLRDLTKVAEENLAHQRERMRFEREPESEQAHTREEVAVQLEPIDVENAPEADAEGAQDEVSPMTEADLAEHVEAESRHEHFRDPPPRRRGVLAESLDVLYDYGVVYAPCLDLVQESPVNIVQLIRTAERVGRMSGRTALVLSYHYISVLKVFGCSKIHAKLKQELFSEVVSRRTILCNLDAIGTVEVTTLPTGPPAFSIRAKATSPVLDADQVGFFLVKVYPDEASMRSNVDAAEILVPVNHQVHCKQLSPDTHEYEVFFEGTEVLWPFLLSGSVKKEYADVKETSSGYVEEGSPIHGLDGHVPVPEGENSAAENGEDSEQTPVFSDEQLNVLHSLLVAAVECGISRIGLRLLGAMGITQESSMEESRELLMNSVHAWESWTDGETPEPEQVEKVRELSHKLARASSNTLAVISSRLGEAELAEGLPDAIGDVIERIQEENLIIQTRKLKFEPHC